jgi:uncharacterized repeat protein (TIGR01451 family)
MVAHGESVTYTISIRDVNTTTQMTDQVPPGLIYIPGTLTATLGAVNDTATPILSWSGTLSTTASVAISYAVTVDITTTQAISNTAVVVAGGAEPISDTATIIANGYEVYLPLTSKLFLP